MISFTELYSLAVRSRQSAKMIHVMFTKIRTMEKLEAMFSEHKEKFKINSRKPRWLGR